METINHECYVPSKVVTLLTKAGFDWKDYFVAHDINEHFHWEIPLHIAQKWLREVKNYDTFVVVDDSYGEYASCILHNKVNEDDYYECFNTYEEALEAGIKKALELILEEGE